MDLILFFFSPNAFGFNQNEVANKINNSTLAESDQLN